MNNKLFRPALPKVALLIAVIFVFIVIAASFAQDANVRTKNCCERVDRVLGPKFIQGFYMIDFGKTAQKGTGQFKGDASIYRIYFPKKKEVYQKMLQDGSLLKSNDTRVIVYVDVFDNPAQAAKNAAIKGLKEGSFSGMPIGDKVWSGKRLRKTMQLAKAEEDAKAAEKAKASPTPKPSPKKSLLPAQERKLKAEEEKKALEDQVKKDKALSDKLEKDPKNFNSKTIVVVKKNAHIYVSAVNYIQEPESSLVEAIAAKITEQF